jgi:hypothetical protein
MARGNARHPTRRELSPFSADGAKLRASPPADEEVQLAAGQNAMPVRHASRPHRSSPYSGFLGRGGKAITGKQKTKRPGLVGLAECVLSLVETGRIELPTF